MECLLGLSLEELAQAFKKMNLPNFRAKQVYKWLHLGEDFNTMSDIPMNLRDVLKTSFTAIPLLIKERYNSKDGSIKFLYELADGNIIEGVFMPHDYGNTLCVSTQVGCRMGCTFCASGLSGLVRHCTTAEILGQITVVNKEMGGNLKNRAITNVVLMGSGEPLDNYNNVAKFLNLVHEENGICIGWRNISLSTCGLVEGIRKLADDGFNVTLSLSLHSTTDEARQKIMPIAKKYKIVEIIDAAKYYFFKTGRRIIFEYSLIQGVNMNYFDAKRLSELLKGLSAHVNLIKLNYVKERDMAGCTDIEAKRFQEKLESFGVSATIRKSVGSDIGGACGQLRNNYIERSAT